MIDFSDLETPVSALPVRSSSASSDVKHTCLKCNGTGKYLGVRRHQPAVECFACGGKGYFKTSAAARKKAREQRAARVARKGDENLALFAEQHPAEAQWLEDNAGTEFGASLRDGVRRYGQPTERQLAAIQRSMAREAESRASAGAFAEEHAAEVAWLRANASSSGFAADLLRGLDKYGRLTERQLAAVTRIVESESRAVRVDLSKVVAAFDAARAAGKKRLKLRVPGFAFSLAGSNSRNAGMIYVKSGEDYLGKVREDGAFFPVRDCTDEQKRALQQIDQDVLAAAKAYGMQTGQCSCCGRELTNKESVALGIGPICLSNWGL